MTLIKSFIEETNFVVGRLLAEFNAFDAPGETKFANVSTQLTNFVQEVKTDERLPMIEGASTVSKLHSAYMTGEFKIFTHEINMHLMSQFTEAEILAVATTLGSGYHQAMSCNAVNGHIDLTQEQAIDVFKTNRWLISLYMVRMNYFTPIVIRVEKPDNEA